MLLSRVIHEQQTSSIPTCHYFTFQKPQQTLTTSTSSLSSLNTKKISPNQPNIKAVKRQMCPLRIIVIFLSATLAGFFVLKKLKSETQSSDDHIDQKDSKSDENSSKVGSAIKSGFLTCVDMASGRYLWRNMVSSKRSD